ncbi:HXXEE domain-containing protein [Methanocella paludicola]|nr:HXXEE domain-containing protein [Methanocella paludicola]
MKIMDFIRGNWYNIGLVVAFVALLYLVLEYPNMGVLQILLLLNFVAILIHQFEEYGFPGGEPAVMNMVLQPSSTPNKYPLNQNSAMITNVVVTYLMYLIPVFFPNIIWLGLAPILFGMMQFIVHGVMTNLKLKSLYNPGLGAVVLLHIPIGLYYIYYIQTMGLASIWDWVIAIVYMVLVAFIVVNKMTYSWLADKNSPNIFSAAEMKRWNVQEKLNKLHGGSPKN